MTDIEIKPAEEQPEKEKPKIEYIAELNKKESDFLLNEFYNLISIYYSVNQLGETELPKNPNWYMNEILKLLKEFKIIE